MKNFHKKFTYFSQTYGKTKATPCLVSGFTLIESLVAITILVTAILGPMTIAATGISSAIYARDQETAFFLAQEGLEYVRNVRDSNVHAGTDWLSGLSTCASGACLIDSPNNIITACGDTCQAIRHDTNTRLYGYDTAWDATSFIRTISISETVPGEEVVVLSTVAWKRGSLADRAVSLEETLFDWQR
jgi:prepilin-type N-terminal cleavage/methylation domain-containing protein